MFKRTYRVVHGFTRDEQLAESVNGSVIPADKIRDMLYVRNLERYIKRKLTSEEMDGQPFMIKHRGHYDTFCVPLLKFPWDLLIHSEDVHNAMVHSMNKKKMFKLHDDDVWVINKKPPSNVTLWVANEEV